MNEIIIPTRLLEYSVNLIGCIHIDVGFCDIYNIDVGLCDIYNIDVRFSLKSIAMVASSSLE